MIILSGIFTSAKILSISGENLSRTKGVLALVSELESKIDALCLPLPEILSIVSEDVFLLCGYSEENKPQNEKDLIEKCSFKDDAPLYSLFSDFVLGFGKCYKNEESKRCKLFCEDIKKLLAKRKEEKEKRKKTIPAICLSISAGIVILLI